MSGATFKCADTLTLQHNSLHCCTFAIFCSSRTLRVVGASASNHCQLQHQVLM